MLWWISAASATDSYVVDGSTYTFHEAYAAAGHGDTLLVDPSYDASVESRPSP